MLNIILIGFLVYALYDVIDTCLYGVLLLCKLINKAVGKYLPNVFR